VKHCPNLFTRFLTDTIDLDMGLRRPKQRMMAGKVLALDICYPVTGVTFTGSLGDHDFQLNGTVQVRHYFPSVVSLRSAND
jgi:hypothetical protein